jgi:hypothetical protein
MTILTKYILSKSCDPVFLLHRLLSEKKNQGWGRTKGRTEAAFSAQRKERGDSFSYLLLHLSSLTRVGGESECAPLFRALPCQLWQCPKIKIGSTAAFEGDEKKKELRKRRRGEEKRKRKREKRR